jgi:hypothetical protein
MFYDIVRCSAGSGAQYRAINDRSQRVASAELCHLRGLIRRMDRYGMSFGWNGRLVSASITAPQWRIVLPE